MNFNITKAEFPQRHITNLIQFSSLQPSLQPLLQPSLRVGSCVT
jgi:hypothetical protein